MRQIANESHSVRQQNLSPRRQRHAAQCGIEGGKHASALQHTGLGERIEQRRLSGIGVADQRDRRDGHGFAPLPLLAANPADILQLLLHVPDAAVDFAAIGFQLGLAGAAGADAAAELRHLDAASRKPRQQVLQLRQFDLELAFAGAGVAREDVEDELGSIDHPHVELAFQVALL